MKKYIFYYLFKYLSQYPKLKKKLLIFAAVVSVFVIISGGLLVWGTFKIVTSLSDKASNMAEQIHVLETSNTVAQKVESFYKSRLENCFNSAVELMNYEKIFLGHGSDLFKNILNSCFKLESKTNCESEKCSNQKLTTEEEFI